jgi:TfoX/Sxy family transcriptional regulator of competence genes
MPYDASAADRVRRILRRRKGFSEKKMFGGLAFLLDGNMCCGVLRNDLVLRLGDEGAAEALRERHVRAMDFTGRPMKSMVYVEPPGYASEAALKRWVDVAAKFARTLPAK